MTGWPVDAAVMAVYFAVIVGIGLRAARGQRNLETFALGGRLMPWWAVLASILASEISAGTFLGTPGEGFSKRAYTYALLAIGTVIARVIVACVFIRPFYDMRVVSIYEYLDNRFGVLTKRMASGVFLLTRSLASGSRIFVAAILVVLVYERMGGLHLDVADAADRATLFQIYLWAVLGITAVTTLYTAVGGIKAVVWTDLIQVVLMFGAAGYVFVWLWGQVGGAPAIAGALKAPVFIDWGLLRGADGAVRGGVWDNVCAVLSSEYTVWAAFLGSVFTTLATHGTDQDMVQRMLTATDTRRSRWAVIGSGLVDVPVVVGFLTIGVMLHLYYARVNSGGLPEGKDVFPWFMVHDLGPGLRGLLAAGLFATAMGSLSTALNALATSFTRDWYVGVLRPRAGEHEQLNAARWSTVGFAVLLALVGIGTAGIKLANPELRIIPIVLGSFGYTYGSLLGVFLLGMLTKTRGNCRGNLIAMLAGFLVVGVLSGMHNDVYDIAHERAARVRGAVKVLKIDAAALRAGSAPEAELARLAAKTRLTPEQLAVVLRERTAHEPWFQPAGMPVIAFTWRIMIGAITTFAVGACFRTRPRAAGAA
jgi:SSS family transporter